MGVNRRQTFTLISPTCARVVTHSWDAQAAPAQGKVWHVDQGAKQGGDGKTRSGAFQSLQDALAAAAGNEIWVTRGTYFPHSDDATQSFTLKADVGVYSGFAGGEAAQRRGRIHHDHPPLPVRRELAIRFIECGAGRQ